MDWKPAPFPQGSAEQRQEGIVLDFRFGTFYRVLWMKVTTRGQQEAIDLHLSAPGSQRYMYGGMFGLFLKALAEKTAVVHSRQEMIVVVERINLKRSFVSLIHIIQ
jgi:hypothetical protein